MPERAQGKPPKSSASAPAPKGLQMTNARFCLEETSFRLPRLTKTQLRSRLTSLLDLMDGCRSEGPPIYRHVSLESELIQPQLPLADLLYPPPGSELLDRELRLRLIIAIDRCQHWEWEEDELDEADEDDEQQVAIEGGGAETAPTIAFVHAQQQKGRALACLIVEGSARKAGKRPVARLGTASDIYFVAAPSGLLQEFYREVIEIEDLDKHAFIKLTPLAFPSLHFVSGIEQQFNAIRQPYQKARPEVTRHLAMLNDHFRGIFAKHQGQPALVEREIKALFDIRLSRESPRTHQNREAMKQRLVKVEDHELPCEWHTKLGYSSGRIHFHPGDKEVAEGKIVIGLFADHLDT